MVLLMEDLSGDSRTWRVDASTKIERGYIGMGDGYL